jgi:hypothetical protein
VSLPKRRKAPKMGVRVKPWWRSHSYDQFVRGFECLAAGKIDACSGHIEAAHVRHGTDGAGNEKPSDWWLVPLCWYHHQPVQHVQGELTFQAKYGIDMKAAAIGIWNKWPKRSQFPGMGPRLNPRSPAVLGIDLVVPPNADETK